jgi:hypothetical protein
MGFHSMVEGFLSAGVDSTELTEMLSEAVSSHRGDLVNLLLDHGADVRSLPFADAL